MNAKRILRSMGYRPISGDEKVWAKPFGYAQLAYNMAENMWVMLGDTNESEQPLVFESTKHSGELTLDWLKQREHFASFEGMSLMIKTEFEFITVFERYSYDYCK